MRHETACCGSKSKTIYFLGRVVEEISLMKKAGEFSVIKPRNLDLNPKC